MLARFQDPAGGGPSLFVLSLKAGGTGLTSRCQDHSHPRGRWLDPPMGRPGQTAFRIGQDPLGQVRKLVCAGHVEEKIALMIRTSGPGCTSWGGEGLAHELFHSAA